MSQNSVSAGEHQDKNNILSQKNVEILGPFFKLTGARGYVFLAILTWKYIPPDPPLSSYTTFHAAG